MRNPRGLDEAAVAGLLSDMNARLDLTHYEELTTISIDYFDFKSWQLPIAMLQTTFNGRCEEYCGCPVLFELIEMAREFLTKRNVPVVR